jgi:MacB-like periplasmic core domain/FtsX-like permease family
VRIIAAWTWLECQRRWRSLAALALLVALATATVLTAVAGARRGQTAFDRLWARTLPATLTVLPNQPGFDWSRIRALPEVSALTTFAVAKFVFDGYPLAAQNTGFPPGDSQVFRTIERPVVLQGRLLDPRRVDEVDVTALFPAIYGKSVGDTLTVQLPSPQQGQDYDPSSGLPPRGPKIRVHIVGVIRSPWFSDSPGSAGGVVPSPALMAHYRASIMGVHDNGFINALVRLRGGTAAIPRFRADLARVTRRSDIDVWDNLASFGVPARKVTGYEAACLLAFGLAALAAAFFLVGQSVARYSSATVSDLQLLRAPGMTPRQATAAACAAPFLAAVAGATVGITGAVVASQWMPIGVASMLEPHPGISADWLVLGAGWAAAPLLVLAGSAVAAATALAASRAQRSPRRSTVALAAARAGAPVPVLIGTRFALEPGRGRSALPVRPALMGAAAGVLGVLAAFTFSAGVTDAAANPARFGQTNQLESYLGENGQDAGPAGPALRAVAASREVTGLDDARVAVAQSGQVSITTYTYDPVGGKRLPVVLTAGRLPTAPDEIVLAPTTASQLHAVTGATVRLTGGTHPVAARVSGIGFVPEGAHNDYDSGAWVTSAGYDRLFSGAHYPFKFHVALVSLRPGADVAAAARRLNAAAGSVNGGHGPEFFVPPPPQNLLVVKDVAALPLALGAFLVLLALAAVGHALATAVHRRRGELAVLRALGMTRLQSRLVVVTQASVLAAVGLAVGVPLGLAIGRFVWRLVALNTPLAYHPPLAFWALVLIGPLALLAANLLAAWPGQRAARLRSAQILRAE